MSERFLTQFWLRKLHSLTGVLFLGYFLCVHVRGDGGYDGLFTRMGFLAIPLVFHALYGLYIVYESQPNNIRYGYWRNWMYLLQRVTALFLIPFIVLHFSVMKGWLSIGEESWYRVFWYSGVVAAVFHLANGLFGAAIEWGVTVGPHSQKVLVILCLLASLVLGGMGIHTLYADF